MIDPGLPSVPNDCHNASREVYPYDPNGERSEPFACTSEGGIPGTEDVGPLERPASLVDGNIVVVVGDLASSAHPGTRQQDGVTRPDGRPCLINSTVSLYVLDFAQDL